ncbi:MAG: hypothetical protein GY715_03395 [Planctomycetes bacterium]|nr:hypothetical protein [Planctomycetota bacterium]
MVADVERAGRRRRRGRGGATHQQIVADIHGQKLIGPALRIGHPFCIEQRPPGSVRTVEHGPVAPEGEGRGERAHHEEAFIHALRDDERPRGHEGIEARQQRRVRVRGRLLVVGRSTAAGEIRHARQVRSMLLHRVEHLGHEADDRLLVHPGRVRHRSQDRTHRAGLLRAHAFERERHVREPQRQQSIGMGLGGGRGFVAHPPADLRPGRGLRIQRVGQRPGGQLDHERLPDDVGSHRALRDRAEHQRAEGRHQSNRSPSLVHGRPPRTPVGARSDTY